MKPSPVSTACRLVGPILALAFPVPADVLVVGYPAGPGVDYTDIQEAVEAAAEGDTILVRAAGTGPFVIRRKSLSVLADGPAVQIGDNLCSPPTCDSSIEVHDLGANQSVLIRGFRTSKKLGFITCAGPHALGGAGVELVDSAAVVRSAESTATGGVKSLGPQCPGQSGPQGPAVTGPGTIVPLPGFARHLRANAPVQGGETLTFEIEGQPGEIAAILVSPVHDPLPFANGVLLLSLAPWEVFVLGALPPSGQTSLSFPVPGLGGSVESLTLYAQSAFLDRTPTVWLGAGTSLVLLAAGI